MEFTKPIQPDSEDGFVELEAEYRWKISERGQFRLQNEITYNFEKKQWAAELTPEFYVNLQHGFAIGFELEIDYLNKDDWDIHQIEIEPTIKWGTKLGPGELDLELEAPVMRLYSSADNTDNFEVETIEPIIEYTLPISKKTKVAFVFGAPYDVEDKEWSTYFDVIWKWKF